MQFSLKTIFALSTLACLYALTIQQRSKVDRLNTHITELKIELMAHDPSLETELEMLRIAAEPNLDFESLYSDVSTANDDLNNKFCREALKTPDRVSISHLPELDVHRRSFSIFVPEGKNASLQVFASTDLFGGELANALTESQFNLNKPTSVDLSSGLSRLSIYSTREKPNKWLFVLNGDEICHAKLKGRNSFEKMIWKMGAQQILGSFRHHNVHNRDRHICSANKRKFEFATFYNSDFMLPNSDGNSVLKCLLLIKNESGGARQ